MYPNILWIQTDEHRCDSLCCYGSPWAQTPNLDRLALQGVLMTHAFCQSPICCASRSSQLCCQYPQEINALSNLTADCPNIFPADVVTFPEILAQHDYHTASYGKSHTPIHPTWQSLDPTVLIREHADYCNMGSKYDPAEYKVVQRPGKPNIIIGGRYPTSFPNPSQLITDNAIRFLSQQKDNEPFLLRVSHNWPHSPVLPPPPFDRLYRKGDIPIELYSKQAKLGRSQRDQWIADRDRMYELSPDQYEQTWIDYMALVSYVDFEIGRLLAALDSSGFSGNTIVLFSSDHGRNLGEYGPGEKCTFDDVSWRVPMIWRWDGHLQPGQRRDDLCELIDTGKTLLHMAGLQQYIPLQWRGRNLFGDPAPEAVYGQIGWPRLPHPLIETEHLQNYTRYQDGVPVWNHPMRMAIRDKRYRLDVDWYRDGQRVSRDQLDGNLFDLQNDPKERQNLYNVPTSQPIINRLLAIMETTSANWKLPV